MFQQLYGWIQNIAVYLIVVTAVMHVIPGKEYGKYVRFFSGLILILLLFTPLLKLTGLEQTFAGIYRSKEYEMERREIENAQEIFGETDLLDFVPEEYQGAGERDGGNRIEVEEIRVGE